jgi:hypothetical protein
MKFRSLLSAAVLFSMSTPAIASAQDEIEAFQNQAAATYGKFIQTAITLISSADTLKAAQGVKTDAAKTKKLLEDMQKGLTKVDGNVLEAATSQIQQDSKELQSMSDSAKTLSEDQKKLLVAGLKQYMSGVRQTAALAGEVPALLSAVATTTAALVSNPLKFRKVKDAVGAAKGMGTGLPAIVKGHVGVVGALKNYMSKQGIKVDPSMFSIGS